MSNTKRWPLALLASVMLAATLGLSACADNGGAPGASAEAAGEGAAASESGELYGSPWITTIVQGNLPKERPNAQDDLYTYCDYDYLSEHQEDTASYMSSSSDEVKEAALAAIKDESRHDHELEQMRILFEQATDTDALAKIGFSEVQPYIDMIDAVSSIDEMNALLVSDDFPFSPFLTAYLAVADTRDENIVAVWPNLIFADPILSGGQYYQDSDDPAEQETNDMMLAMSNGTALMDASLIGLDIHDEHATDDLRAFEKSYAKYVDYGGKWLTADFGAQATDAAESTFTLAELCELCPNLPMEGMLAKLGKDGSKLYYVTSHEWIPALSDAWTEDNLEVIKLAAKCKVLIETGPYRDPSVKNEEMSMDGLDGETVSLTDDAANSESFAYDACDSLDTFAQVIAKIYVEDALGQKASDRLEALTQDLITTYKDLAADSAWLGTESGALVTEKLDHMALNVLAPDDGYFDYSKLELIPTADGGTLLTNYLRLKQYRYDREAALIGKPATASVVWYEVTPTMANAFYDPLSNSINILPGFVTSAVYRSDMSDTELIAGAGFVIGHEISHGFDYQGSQFDAYAQPNPIYSADDAQTFVAKCASLADRYSAIETQPGKFVNGQNVVAEAAADLSGLQASMVLAEAKDADREEFYGYFAQLWASVVDSLTTNVTSGDAHPANNLRVNVNVQMFDQFYETYGVKKGDGMYLAPDKRVVFWGEQA